MSPNDIRLVKRESSESDDELFHPIRVMCEINGFSVPAIIDTGAQISIMSCSCAKRCRLFGQIDSDYSGKARGVGSGDILGRLDNLLMRVGPISFRSRISVLRDAHVDFLIGLDFLQRFKCDINLTENILHVHLDKKSVRIPFFSDSDGVSGNEDNNFKPNNIFESSLEHAETNTDDYSTHSVENYKHNIRSGTKNSCCLNQNAHGDIANYGEKTSYLSGFVDTISDNDAEIISMEGV